MIALIFFGLAGGFISAVLTYPHGLVLAFLAYVFGGAVSMLIPRTLALLIQGAKAQVSGSERLSSTNNAAAMRHQPRNTA